MLHFLFPVEIAQTETHRSLRKSTDRSVGTGCTMQTCPAKYPIGLFQDIAEFTAVNALDNKGDHSHRLMNRSRVKHFNTLDFP